MAKLNEVTNGGGIDSNSALATDLKNTLSRKGLHAVEEWMLGFLSTQRPTTRSESLASTATFRLLASNITSTLSKSMTAKFPKDVQDASIKERRLPTGDLVIQILDIEDMGRSRWEQVEALEALERGEGTKGKELIRLDTAQDGDEDGSTGMQASSTVASDLRKSKGPHKILMQDVYGNVAFGIELSKIEGLNLNMNIGAKLLLRAPLVARGVLLLEPSTTTWLGGKIESLHQTWVKVRKERLMTSIATESAN